MSSLTEDLKEANKIVLDKYKKKIKNIYGGIKETFKKKNKNKKNMVRQIF